MARRKKTRRPVDDARHAPRPPAKKPTGRIIRSMLHWAVQIAICAVGISIVGGGDLFLLSVWCMLGTLYAIVVVMTLAVLARGRARPVDDLAEVPRWFARTRSVVTVVLAAVPFLVGVSAAALVVIFGKGARPGSFIASISDGTELSEPFLVKIVGVWAMLLAWALLHWGYAQIYLGRTEAALPGRVLDFPGTPDPTIVDHVYFAFTLGTTFAASDVSVLDSRLRWTVTGHSVLSFLINGLIVVLSFNTIMGATG